MAVLQDSDSSPIEAPEITASTVKARLPVGGSVISGPRGFRQISKSIVFCVKRAVETVLLYLWDTLVFLQTPGRLSSILVVKTDEIGDFLIWLDSAKEIKRLYPDRQVILVGNKAWADLAHHLPYWDLILPLEPRRLLRHPFYRLVQLARIRRLGGQTAIHPVYSRNFMVGDAILRVCGAAERIGFNGDLSNFTAYQKRLSDRWYSDLVTMSSPCLSEIRRHSELTRALGAKNFKPLAPRITPLQNVRGVPSTPATPYYVVVPGSYRQFKQWPHDNFAGLMDLIHQSYDLTAVICGGEKEKAVARKITQIIQAPAMDLTGRTTLPQLTEVIRCGLFLVGNDSGAVHLAAALAKPSICILGGGHFGRFLPYEVPIIPPAAAPQCVFLPMPCQGCNWRCRYTSNRDKTVPCIEQISVESVFQKIQQIEGIQRLLRGQR